MIAVSIRVSEDTIAFVKQETKKRGIATEAEMWRILIERGVAASEGTQAQIDALIKIGVQSLCLTQRFAGAQNESLIAEAREDARSMLDRMGMI